MEHKARPGFIRRTLSGIWRALDRIRQASLNLIFLAVVAFLVAGWLASRPAPLPPDAALLIAPKGQLVEQRSVKSPMSLLQGGDGVHQVELADQVQGGGLPARPGQRGGVAGVLAAVLDEDDAVDVRHPERREQENHQRHRREEDRLASAAREDALRAGSRGSRGGG